jgi:heme-degrading monooxygenase HmoA
VDRRGEEVEELPRPAEGGDLRSPAAPAREMLPTDGKKLIARIWRGQTRASVSEEYSKYLYEKGVCEIAKIAGNRGVQMLRMVRDDIAEFQVLSYWSSIDAIKGFAGDDYEKVRHLPDDSKYMIGLAPTVQHFEVVVNDWR